MIELVLGDITTQHVDAIVNAANSTLLGGGGVDGAIHRAGGPAILAECRQLGGCAPGDAKATTAGDLPARYVFHAVGPVWRGGADGEPDLLASCHRRAIELAAERACASLAFPAISTGAYGYPVELAAPVAIGATTAALAANPTVELARFVFRDERARAVPSGARSAQVTAPYLPLRLTRWLPTAASRSLGRGRSASRSSPAC